jgi:carbohydrate-binding DOMON domain-containing protein
VKRLCSNKPMASERPVSTSEVTGLLDFERKTRRKYELLEDKGILEFVAERLVSLQFHSHTHTHTQTHTHTHTHTRIVYTYINIFVLDFVSQFFWNIFQECSLLHVVQTGSGVHLASY